MTVEELVQQVVSDVPEAPLMSIRDALSRACRELCLDADVWITRDDVVVSGAKTSFSEIEVPPGAEGLRIVSLNDGDRPLKPGVDYMQTDVARVEFLRTPKSSALLGELSVRPVLGQHLPDDLLSRWAETIGDGARYHLLMLPQSWRDTRMAEYYRQQFSDGKNTAKQLSRLGHQMGGARVKLRRYF